VSLFRKQGAESERISQTLRFLQVLMPSKL
jgi:hypothetical protein